MISFSRKKESALNQHSRFSGPGHNRGEPESDAKLLKTDSWLYLGQHVVLGPGKSIESRGRQESYIGALRKGFNNLHLRVCVFFVLPF